MADLWSDYADVLIKGVDKSLVSKYKISASDLFTDMTEYMSQPNLRLTIENMKDDSNKYVDGLLAGMPEAVKELNDNMAKANEATRQLSQNISMQAKQHDVPFIKPYDIARDTDSEEVIQVDLVNDQILKLVEKLVVGSNMVADFTYGFKNYNVGSWLFDRNVKNYRIDVYLPDNDAFDIELGRDEVNDLFDEAAGMARG